MGIAERKLREKDYRRNQIINAAMQVFLERGYVNTTMEVVAEQAEYSKATLYLYFKNKEDLFMSVLGMVFDEFNNHLLSIISTGQTPLERVQKLGDAYLSFYRDHPGHFALVNNNGAPTDLDLTVYDSYLKLTDITCRTWKIVCAPISECIDAGIFKPDTDPLEIGVLFWSSSNGVLNLMQHVGGHYGDQMEKYEQHDDFLCAMNKLDYESMLRKLWNGIVAAIMK